jgi:ABC-type transporter Mla MlaB component
MIRLTQAISGEQVRTVRLDGRLDAQAVPHLREAIATPGGDPAHVRIDLEGLASLDSAGRAALIELREAGHRLVGASLYIRHLLEETRP